MKLTINPSTIVFASICVLHHAVTLKNIVFDIASIDSPVLLLNSELPFSNPILVVPFVLIAIGKNFFPLPVLMVILPVSGKHNPVLQSVCRLVLDFASGPISKNDFSLVGYQSAFAILPSVFEESLKYSAVWEGLHSKSILLQGFSVYFTLVNKPIFFD